MDCMAAIGSVVNIGSGFEISIGETAQLVADVMGADIEIVSDRQRLRPDSSEVERLFAATEKDERLFGWAPDYAGTNGFRRGLARTVQWFQQPGQLSRYKATEYNI